MAAVKRDCDEGGVEVRDDATATAPLQEVIKRKPGRPRKVPMPCRIPDDTDMPEEPTPPAERQEGASVEAVVGVVRRRG